MQRCETFRPIAAAGKARAQPCNLVTAGGVQTYAAGAAAQDATQFVMRTVTDKSEIYICQFAEPWNSESNG